MSDSEQPESKPATQEQPAPAAEPARREPQPAKKPGGFPRRPRTQIPVPPLDEVQLPRSTLSLRELDAEIEGELEAALAGISDKDLQGGEAPAPAKKAALSDTGGKKGKVISVHGQDVFIQIPGGRSQGVLAVDQFPEGAPAPGTEVDVHIEGYDESNGLLLLSRRGAAVAADWSSVTPGQTVEARVTATNKGGLEVNVNGIRGFMPISQIDLYRVENADQYVNQKLLCLVAEVNPQERNLIVSRRALLEKEREEQREKLWQELAEGQVREGVVRSVRDFGAFVDLGGADGLLHISEMSWTRVQDPASVVQPGQRIKVVVLKVDHDKRKVSLGLKQLLASPWDNIDEKYPPSTRVAGTVTRLADFGAFVELEPGVEGLIHISELAPQRVRRVGDIVQEGQEVQVMILNVDAPKRRISLSLKAALPTEEGAAEEEAVDAAPEKPPRPRSTPLRGGIGEG
jgi:small subunit ribosomal protein S1